MRLDVDVPNPLNRRAWVFLDGVRQHRVVMVDDELGVMERLAVDSRGRYIVERGEVKTITLRGRVWIFDSRFTDFGKWEDV